VVAFVKDGDILVWEEATGQSKTILEGGDVISLTMSDDGQVIAFLRRSVVQRSELDWYEQSALWVVDLNGGNQRELVSTEELRSLLSASETDSTNIPQMEWLPGTHRLVYTGWTYFVQAEGESHATPAGLYLVDADTLTNSILLPAANNLRFVAAPDGQQIALLSTTGLGFINADGSNHRPAVFPYAQVGMAGQAFPSGVWSQDARAFLIATYLEKSLDTDPGLAIWRVPLDGSPARLTDAITGTHPDSVTFSPDGRYAAFFRADSPAMVTHYGWFVTTLIPEAGPLATSGSAYLFWQNLHWSPAGAPYAINEGTLFPLCPDPAQDAEICGEGKHLGDQLAEIRWIDGNRFLFVTREPYDLFFGTLDGTSIRLGKGVERFSAVAMNCRNESAFAERGEGPAYLSVAPDTLFRKTWRLRNTGTCTWDPSYRLAFLGGERMSGPRSLPLGETVQPGGEIELSVKLIAPAGTGSYQGEWQLSAPNGKPFGIRTTVDVVVPSFTIMEFAPDQIVAKILAGSDSISLGEGALWVLGGDNTLSRIDPNTNRVVATIPVSEFPADLAIGYGAVWASVNGTIIRVDPQSNQVTATIPFAPLSTLNGLSAGAGSVWATNGEEGKVYRIDPNTNQVVTVIDVESWASQIVATEDAVWVTNPITPVLTRIDPSTLGVAIEIELDCATRGLAVDANAIWLACDSVPALFRVDPLTNQIAARIALSNRPNGVAISSKGVWVTSFMNNALTLIDPDTNQVIGVYQVGQGPSDIVAAQDELWVAMGGEGSVWRIRP
jgi:YVTN family beta-propeller protein